uniref:Uncharacterized protein n=1 Tax=Anopheles epiroticus TaxID=199890 RepID=A0A182P3R7_9DIPT
MLLTYNCRLDCATREEHCDDIQERPHVTTLISSLANYSNTIAPAPTDPDAKPAPAAARMGK